MSRITVLKSRNYRITPENEAEKWTCTWLVAGKKSGEEAGRLRFLGAPDMGRVTIEAEGDGDALIEAGKALTDWAFSQTDVFIILAEPSPVFTALNFKEKDGKLRLDKPPFVWMAVYMCLGISLGSAIGTSTGHAGTFMCLGIAIGVALGKLMEKKEAKRRADVTGEAPEKKQKEK